MSALHQICVGQFVEHHYASLLQAIVCGKNLVDESLKGPLVSAGVIHLFVVSGGHLVFFSEWLDRVSRFIGRPIPLHFIYSILILYGSVAQFQPPIVRGLVYFGASKLSDKFRLGLPEWLVQLSSGLLAFAILPSGGSGVSLIMSWQASLCLQILSKRSGTIKAIGVYFAMMPILTIFSVPSPFSIVVNVALVPLFSLILLPLSVVSATSNFMQVKVMPLIFDVMYDVLKRLEFVLIPIPLKNTSVSMLMIVLFLAFLHFLIGNKSKRST